ncbi:hypothetical protein CRG98_008012, partial [Punica granatum]
MDGDLYTLIFPHGSELVSESRVQYVGGEIDVWGELVPGLEVQEGLRDFETDQDAHTLYVSVRNVRKIEFYFTQNEKETVVAELANQVLQFVASDEDDSEDEEQYEDENEDEDAWELESDGLNDSYSDDAWLPGQDGDEHDDCTGDDRDAGEGRRGATMDKTVNAAGEVLAEEAEEEAREKGGEGSNRAESSRVFKEAVKDYTISIGREVVMKKNDKGLRETIKELCPDIIHRFCVKHLEANVWRNWHRVDLKKKIWQCTRSNTIEEFERYFAELRCISEEAYEYLQLLDKHSRTRVAFKVVGIDAEKHVNPCYSKETWEMIYAPCIALLRVEDQWIKVGVEPVEAPRFAKGGDRPKKKKFKANVGLKTHISLKGSIRKYNVEGRCFVLMCMWLCLCWPSAAIVANSGSHPALLFFPCDRRPAAVPLRYTSYCFSSCSAPTSYCSGLPSYRDQLQLLLPAPPRPAAAAPERINKSALGISLTPLRSLLLPWPSWVSLSIW